MELKVIKSLLESPNPKFRMKALVELRQHPPDISVPLLESRMHDQEFMIRSFVAMGLGHKRTDEAFELLLNIIENETDHNVIAEAANSLAKYGPQSIPYLVELFENNAHWLIRQSILAAVDGIDYPDVFVEMCRLAYLGDDPIVKQTAIAYLAQLRATSQASEALSLLLEASISPEVAVRAQAATVLREFDHPQAEAALSQLRQDPDHRVVGATLEGLL